MSQVDNEYDYTPCRCFEVEWHTNKTHRRSFYDRVEAEFFYKEMCDSVGATNVSLREVMGDDLFIDLY